MTGVVSEGRTGGCWGWWRSGATVACFPFLRPPCLAAWTECEVKGLI